MHVSLLDLIRRLSRVSEGARNASISLGPHEYSWRRCNRVSWRFEPAKQSSVILCITSPVRLGKQILEKYVMKNECARFYKSSF